MIRRYKDLGTGEVKEIAITEEMVYKTKAFARWYGYPYINVVQAVQSYTNPTTDQQYTEDEAKLVLTNLGVDFEKDVKETDEDYERYRLGWQKSPVKFCYSCGHPETGHHLNGTNRCQFKDCYCKNIVIDMK